MIKNIIFDWSGVINDNTYYVYQAVSEVLKTYNGPEISFDEFRKEFHTPYMSFYYKYLPELTLEQQNETYKKIITKFDKNKFFEGVLELVKKFFNKGIKMFVVTSDNPETIYPQIELYGLNKVFAKVYTSLHDKEEATKSIINEFNLDPKNTIIISDTNHEIEIGQKLGIKTGAVTWGLCLEEKLKLFNPDFMIHNLEELERTIFAINL